MHMCEKIGECTIVSRRKYGISYFTTTATNMIRRCRRVSRSTNRLTIFVLIVNEHCVKIVSTASRRIIEQTVVLARLETKFYDL